MERSARAFVNRIITKMWRLVPALVIASAIPVAAGQRNGTDWSTYTNATIGLTLQHPPTLQPRLSRSNELVLLDFVTRDIDAERPNLGQVVALRVIINDIRPPNVPVPLSFYQNQQGYRLMTVGGRPAPGSSPAAAVLVPVCGK
jgi:hypothetical protein